PTGRPTKGCASPAGSRTLSCAARCWSRAKRSGAKRSTASCCAPRRRLRSHRKRQGEERLRPLWRLEAEAQPVDRVVEANEQPVFARLLRQGDNHTLDVSIAHGPTPAPLTPPGDVRP